jgi:serine/threonine protein kinase
MTMPFAPQLLIQERYRLVQQLGRNGNRLTWLAEDEQTEKQVTLKALAFDAQTDWQNLKLIEREAVTLRCLEYPRIPKFVDSFWLQEGEEHLFCLVHSYIPGQSLAELLKAGQRWSPEEVLELAQSVLEILDYLHCQSPPVIHRDIKPSNIVQTEDGQIYLIDFGSVQGHQGDGLTMTVVGTFGYMPPEQFYGQTEPASDLYSLGATLLSLISGSEPSRWPRQGMQVQLKDWLRLGSLENWLERLLEPEASKRFQTAKEALHALKNPSSLLLSPASSPPVAPAPLPFPRSTVRRFSSPASKIWLKPIFLPTENVEWISAGFDTQVAIKRCGDVLQISIPAWKTRNPRKTWDFPLLAVIQAAVLLPIGWIFRDDIGALSYALSLLAINLLLSSFAILPKIWQHSKLTLDKERFLIERSTSAQPVESTWFRTVGAPLKSLTSVFCKVENKRECTLILMFSDGAREKLGEGLTLQECQWLCAAIKDWLP